MLKDPNHTDETPYELLRLPFDAPLTEVRDALKRFMREQLRTKPQLLGAAQQAQKKLQNPLERANLDIWLYDVQISGQIDTGAPTLDLDQFSRPKALAPSMLYCCLSEVDGHLFKLDIASHRTKFSDVRIFDDLETFKFTPQFDC